MEIEENTKVILLKGFEFLDFQSMGKKIVYHICAKSVNFWQLRERIATKWRTYLSLPSDVNPSWRLLYKPPIPKKNVEIYSGEYFIACCLQTTLFLSSMKWLNLNVLFVRLLTLFHLFCECSRFTLLFVLLEKLIMKFGFSFTKTLFIFGCKYKQSWREQCVHANFLLGQAKLGILKTHQCKNTGHVVDLLSLFKSLVEFRVAVEFAYYKQTDNVPFFKMRWGVRDALVTLSEFGNMVFNW